MATTEPLDNCQHCKNKRVLCAERTTSNRLEVWLCPECDGRALNFAKLESES